MAFSPEIPRKGPIGTEKKPDKLVSSVLTTTLKQAKIIANNLGLEAIGSDHILIALSTSDSLASNFLRGEGIRTQDILNKISPSDLTKKGFSSSPNDRHLTSPSADIIINEATKMVERTPEKLNTLHLLLAIIKGENSQAKGILDKLGIKKDYVSQLRSMAKVLKEKPSTS